MIRRTALRAGLALFVLRLFVDPRWYVVDGRGVSADVGNLAGDVAVLVDGVHDDLDRKNGTPRNIPWPRAGMQEKGRRSPTGIKPPQSSPGDSQGATIERAADEALAPLQLAAFYADSQTVEVRASVSHVAAGVASVAFSFHAKSLPQKGIRTGDFRGVKKRRFCVLKCLQSECTFTNVVHRHLVTWPSTSRRPK